MKGLAFWLVYLSIGLGVASSEPEIRITSGDVGSFLLGTAIWPGLVAARVYERTFREELAAERDGGSND